MGSQRGASPWGRHRVIMGLWGHGEGGHHGVRGSPLGHYGFTSGTLGLYGVTRGPRQGHMTTTGSHVTTTMGHMMTTGVM